MIRQRWTLSWTKILKNYFRIQRRVEIARNLSHGKMASNYFGMLLTFFNLASESFFLLKFYLKSNKLHWKKKDKLASSFCTRSKKLPKTVYLSPALEIAIIYKFI